MRKHCHQGQGASQRQLDGKQRASAAKVEQSRQGDKQSHRNRIGRQRQRLRILRFFEGNGSRLVDAMGQGVRI
ncbi:hypothetical protein SDC9_99736 [bioreactor metagenome]|uniref:Uncharacterized protein n=1 Tax=bioreactor metagenome TaxID=1076179 RepID=A0A645AIC2_9ZZZZ